MSTVGDVYDFLDTFAPFATQLGFDNSGLLVGSREREVRHIGVVLDITPDAVDFARENGIDLIVSHHPVIFHPLKRLVPGSPAYELASSGIAAVCCHTPLDSAAGGINDVLASLLGLVRAEPLGTDGEAALARVGLLGEPVTAAELASAVASALRCEPRYNDCGRMIETVAVCSGAGASLLDEVAEAEVDAFITGDFGHHDFLDAAEYGITAVAAGHFETENIIVPVLAEMLDEAIDDVNVTVIPQSAPTITKTFKISQ